MAWKVSLCVYKSPGIQNVGHAFATVSCDDHIVAAAGLSPWPLPETFLQEVSKVIPGPGRIYSEWDSLASENLRKKSWEIREERAQQVLNKINQDRRTNLSAEIPDGDGIPAHQLVEMSSRAQDKGEEWVGGPNYALLWSNCASYALDVVAEAGVNVAMYRHYVDNPAFIHSLLGQDAA